jgi:hypothetical protein
MSNMSQGRQISAHKRLIRPGGGKSGLGQGNPGLARPEQCSDGGPKREIPTRPDPPDPAQPGAGGKRPGDESWPGQILLIRPSRALGRGRPAGTRSEGAAAQPGRASQPSRSDSGGPARGWMHRPSRLAAHAGESAGKPSRDNRQRPSRDRGTWRPTAGRGNAGPAGRSSDAGLGRGLRPSREGLLCRPRLPYAGPERLILAWTPLIRPKEL